MKKLQNKKTGEIGELQITAKHYAVVVGNGTASCNAKIYCSLDKLNAEWEDYHEELKGSALDLIILTLINFIENEPDEDKVDLEDCKQMLEKLKAWKRLKDKGFRFEKYEKGEYGPIIIELIGYVDKEADSLLDLLFGGEE